MFLEFLANYERNSIIVATPILSVSNVFIGATKAKTRLIKKIPDIKPYVCSK